MESQFRDLVARESEEAGVSATIDVVWHSPAVRFDDDCISAVRQASDSLDLEAMEIVSGAGQVSVYLSRVAPTSMIFVPCKDGISHNEAEDAERTHIEAGANVLLHAMLERAE